MLRKLLVVNETFSLQSVEPQIEEDQLGDMLANMTSGENSELSKLVNVGDSQAALRMAGAVNSLLNAQSSKTPSNDSEGDSARREKRKAVNISFPLRIYRGKGKRTLQLKHLFRIDLSSWASVIG